MNEYLPRLFRQLTTESRLKPKTPYKMILYLEAYIFDEGE